ncbi:RNA polymerase sigma factor [Terriglobus albidus]|uniref:RNA polymerase sigma factor n=1 Tax=Terriglobus albidus TaxID=1592106 RepID=UPI0021DF51A4|nr:RNA polymerase sigma factor [Terriglobus albidus]
MRWFELPARGTPSVREDGPDKDLALRLKRRDKDSFLALYDRYGRTVYRYLMHMTGSISAAEELTQEVFIVILDAMATPEPMRSFDPAKGTLEGYLLGIARNLARQEHRRSLRLLSLDEMQGRMDWTGLFNNIQKTSGSWEYLAALTTQTEIKLLHRFILELPEHYRTVVVLCALQEKSYRDVAAMLQCSEGTVASRLNRAKVLLTAKLTAGDRSRKHHRKLVEGGLHAKASVAKG